MCLVIAQRLDHLVVGVGKRSNHHLATRCVRVTTTSASQAAGEGRTEKAKVKILAAAFSRRDLHPRANVHHEQRGRRLIHTNVASNSTGGNTQRTGQQATQAATTTTRLARELDGRTHQVVGRDHLPTAHVATGAPLVTSHQVAFTLHGLQARTTLDDDKTVALLDHQAKHGDGRSQVVLTQLRIPGRLHVFFHRQRAQRLGAALEVALVARSGGATRCSGNRGVAAAHAGRRGKAAA